MRELDKLYSQVLEGFVKYRKTAPIRRETRYQGAGKEGERYFDNKLRKEVFMFIGTRGCRWYLESGGCFMCSYNVGEPLIEYSSEDIIKQVEERIQKFDLKKYEVVYVFPYSSFDPLEMPKKAREFVYDLLNQYENIKYVIFQTRPEFIKKEILLGVKKRLPNKICYVTIGLESSDDFISKYCVHKGYGFEEVKEKIKLLKKYGIHSGVFILFKPPFLTEKEAINP